MSESQDPVEAEAQALRDRVRSLTSRIQEVIESGALNDADIKNLQKQTSDVTDSFSALTPETREEVEAQVTALEMEVAKIEARARAFQWDLENRTARKLEIRGNDDVMVPIPPHGTVRVDHELYEKLELSGWRQRGLVESKQVPETTSESFLRGEMALGCGALLFWLFVGMAIAGLVVREWRTNPQFWYILGGSVVFVILVAVVIAVGKEKLADFFGGVRNRAMRPLNVVILFMVGLGLPALTIYFFGGGHEILDPSLSDLTMLGRALQFVVIGIASLLPALLYFLFERQQLGEVKENFYREVMCLDPDIQTKTEAETKYSQLVQETFGSSQAGGFLLGTGSPILISTLLMTMVWTVALLPVGPVGEASSGQLADFITPRQHAVVLGLLGVYFFAINMLFRRYVRADLTPKAYTHITLRLLTTVILVGALSALPVFSNQESGEASWVLLVFAFFVGIFPETGLVVLRDALRSGPMLKVVGSWEEEHPITDLEGINLYDRARLLEEGIESVENLAHHDLIELMLRTRIPTPRLVDLFDQAVLYLHICEVDKDRGKRLRQYGIRTATDLETAYSAAGGKVGSKSLRLHEAPEAPEAQALLGLLDGPEDGGTVAGVKRLKVVMDAMWDDEWMPHLRNWREFGKATPTAESPKDFDKAPH